MIAPGCSSRVILTTLTASQSLYVLPNFSEMGVKSYQMMSILPYSVKSSRICACMYSR